MKKSILLNIIEWALRINVFVKLFIYGTGKIIGQQFYRKGNIPEEVGAISLAETGSYNLAWTFFGHSQGYILFIGISQIIGAILFLIPRTKLLGGAILIPILLNIIVVDLFFGVAYGAVFSACFYLASILWIYYRYRVEVIEAVKRLLPSSGSGFNKNQLVLQWALLAVAFAGIFCVELFFIDFFGYEDR